MGERLEDRSFVARLHAGESCKCKKCKSGVYKPFNTDSSKAHSFVCDSCGDTVLIEDAVLVK